MDDEDRPPEPRSLPPSRYHDQAYRRDAGHDAMQAEFMNFMRGRKIGGLPRLAHREVDAEMPIFKNGEIISYADVAEILHVGLNKTVWLFEIKPKIHTVFGVVRQAKSQLALAQKYIKADVHILSVVAPASDPLINELRKSWKNTWAWGWKPGEEKI